MKYACFVTAAMVIFSIGCSGTSIEITEVQGTVTLDGAPLPEVKITFSPDPAKSEELGRPSHAITDADGKYRLKYSGDQAEFGAQVGWHLVTAIDVMAENSRDDPIPPRISSRYAQASAAKLEFEVKPGEEPQTIDFELEGF